MIDKPKNYNPKAASVEKIDLEIGKRLTRVANPCDHDRLGVQEGSARDKVEDGLQVLYKPIISVTV
jgi:hypothetical protein